MNEVRCECGHPHFGKVEGTKHVRCRDCGKIYPIRVSIIDEDEYESLVVLGIKNGGSNDA